MEPAVLDTVRERFRGDRFATDNGARIDEVGHHYAKCSLTLEPHHRNAMGAIMGGVAFTLADFAFAVAANWEQPGTVSLDSSITYLGAVHGARLIAEANCIKHGRTTSCYRIDVRDDLGNLVAAVMTTGFFKA